jgi:hypothetical protein
MKLESFHLRYDGLTVEARILRANGKYVASVDTCDGPTLGCGGSALAALWSALEPYDHIIGELLSSLSTTQD